jgi:HEAT repeat protein
MAKLPSERENPGQPGAVALPWLPAMQPPTVAAALRDAASPKIRFRRDAARALRGAEGDLRPQAVEMLRRMLEDPDAIIRALAAESLAVLDDTASRDAVAKLVDDADEGVRGAAVESLAGLSGDDPEHLRKLLVHARPEVRARACAALGELGGARVEADLERALADDNAEVRGSAVAALGWWFPRGHAAALRRTLADKNPDVALAAADALAFRGDDAGRDVLRRRVAEGPVDDVWNQAFARLARVARAEDRELLAARAKWPTRRLRRAVALAGLVRLGDADAAAQLRKWLAHRDPKRRGEALLAVGFARAPGFRDAVEKDLRRPESPLFETALTAAVQSGDRELSAAIVETARTTADRAAFEELASVAVDLARILGDDAPQELRDLARAEFQPQDGTGEKDAPDA